MENASELFSEFAERAMAIAPVWIYLSVVMASFVENLFPLFPGDLVTVLAAALAVLDHVSPVGVFVAAYVGSVGSTMILYGFGRRYGRAYLERRRFAMIPQRRIEKLERMIARYGAWAIVANRFVVGARTLIVLLAGIGRWPAGRMFLWSSVSLTLFNSLLIWGTYAALGNVALVRGFLETYQTIVWILLGAAVGAFMASRLARRRATVNQERPHDKESMPL